ncbi:MAG: ATP-binding protein [Actinobacteria bacterium]|nr:ATP-binding protein [Actinomycetota bacterium]
MIISVASGKGGTGKTTVAVSLAMARGYCNFMDYDVEAPNASFFLKPDIKNEQTVTMKQPYFLTETGADFKKCAEFCHFNAVAVAGKEVIFFPELCHGCGGCLLVGPEGSVMEKDVEVGKIRKGKADPGISFFMGDLKPGYMRTITIQSEMDKLIEHDKIVIIDCPPGTSCPMVFSLKDSDYCVLVTEPTPYGLNDLDLSIEVLKSMKIPYGVIINRDGIGDGKVEEYCNKNNIKILLKIPNDMGIARNYSRGVSLVEYDNSWAGKFNKILDFIEKEAV